MMIDIRGLCVCTPGFQLGPIDLAVAYGEHVVLAGPSGCGKTTLLETIAGLRRTAHGTVRLGGVDVTKRRPADRFVGYVPQDCALFSSMSVEDNLAFGMRARGYTVPELERRVQELADSLRLHDLLGRDAKHLSGGERQRIALGRALAVEPDVLLLDEPFSALDAESRSDMYDLMSQLSPRFGCTVLHVSHSIKDAEACADRIVRMSEGRLLTRQAPIHADVPSQRTDLPGSISERLSWETRRD